MQIRYPCNCVDAVGFTKLGCDSDEITHLYLHNMDQKTWSHQKSYHKNMSVTYSAFESTNGKIKMKKEKKKKTDVDVEIEEEVAEGKEEHE